MQRLRAERERRRRLQRGYTKSFRDFIAEVNPRLEFYPHIEKLIAVLQRVADDELDRLMIYMPPRHGKSETVSRLFSAYYLLRHPNRWVGLNSYAAELAYSLSRNARENFTRGGGEMRYDAAAVKHWQTNGVGGMWAAGVGGPITGKGFHLGIIDDPLKNAEDANSEKIRAKQKDWYRSTFYTRGEPGNAIIVVQTRWNTDDLSGWLLTSEKDEDQEPERWHVMSMPAIAEAEKQQFPAACTVEDDERSAGEALCSERYDVKKLNGIARRVGSYFWNALYQQTPIARDGNMFQRHWFRLVDAIPANAKKVRFWDMAATTPKAGSDPDWTVGLLGAMDEDKHLYICDIRRTRDTPGQIEKLIRQTAQLDGPNVVQLMGEEAGSAGKKQIHDYAVRILAGFPFGGIRETGDKVTRAMPVSSQAEVGNISIVKGPWIDEFFDEIEAFPLGVHDDQVDAMSGALMELIQGAGSWLIG